MKLLSKCPKCKVSLKGEEISKSFRKFFGGQKYTSRLIGVYDWLKDRTVAWKCPDCGHTWER